MQANNPVSRANHLAIKALMRNILIGALGLILFTDSDIE